MKLFMVRLIETREAVGLFWSTRDGLWWAVDECTDPGGCEYAVITDPCSILWTNRTKVQFGVGFDADDFDDDNANPLGDASLGEKLWDWTQHRNDLKWTKLPYATEVGGGIYEIHKANHP